MTLVVGIKCRNGVVLAADSAATMGTSQGIRTAQQRFQRKLFIASDHVVMGSAGAVGLAQQHRGGLIELTKKGNPFDNLDAAIGAHTIAKELWKHTEDAINRYQASSSLTGQQGAADCNNSTLIAFPSHGEACLAQFGPGCHPELATAELPFAAIGSGQVAADFFLAFVRRVMWGADMPNLDDGIFAAVWTLQHAIDVGVYGVAGPVQIAVLETRESGKNKTRELDVDEIGQYQQQMERMETLIPLAKAGKLVESTPELPAPSPPPPPAAL